MARRGRSIEHPQHKGLNNRAQNSHQPTRRRERILRRFKWADRHNCFCQSTIRSPIFLRFPIRSRQPPRNVALCATAPSRFGATSPRQPSRSEHGNAPRLITLAHRRFNLTVPYAHMPMSNAAPTSVSIIAPITRTCRSVNGSERCRAFGRGPMFRFNLPLFVLS
jgi:hypothetical protein